MFYEKNIFFLKNFPLVASHFLLLLPGSEHDPIHSEILLFYLQNISHQSNSVIIIVIKYIKKGNYADKNNLLHWKEYGLESPTNLGSNSNTSTFLI